MGGRRDERNDTLSTPKKSRREKKKRIEDSRKERVRKKNSQRQRDVILNLDTQRKREDVEPALYLTSSKD